MARIINYRFRKDGAWLGESGKFLYEVSTGNNRRFDRSTVTVNQGEARLLYEPEQDITGNLRFLIKWSYGPGGKADFTLHAFDEAIPDGMTASTRSICSGVQKHRGSLLGDSGLDTVRLAIPSGFEVSSARVVAISGRANIINSPQLPGVTNSANVQVAWKYDMGGKVEYFICIKAIAKGLMASISNLIITPNPAIAGSAITGTASIKNSGSVSISHLTVSIQVKALTLEDFPAAILNSLSEDVRTHEVFNDTRSVNLQPGQQITKDLYLAVPNRLLAPGNPSSAGTYEVLIAISAGGVELSQIVFEPLIITKPPET